jgi:hypothetical protein
MGLKIEIDLDEWYYALDVMEGPGIETVEALDAVLQTGLAFSQAQVHAETGSLRASGHAVSARIGEEWTGDIIFGGPAPGYPHNPVDYAIYEYERGGAHDFLYHLSLLSDQFVEAMFATVKARL